MNELEHDHTHHAKQVIGIGDRRPLRPLQQAH